MRVNKEKLMSVNSVYHMTESKLTKEKDLIESAKRDPRRFAPLYEKYYEQIFRYIHQRMNDMDDAAEVCSLVFMKAMSKIQQFEFRGVPFSAWLYRIAYNELHQFFRDRQKDQTVNVDKEQLELVLSSLEEENDEEGLMSRKRQLIELLQTLDEATLELIEMRFFDEMSFKEIAAVLDITENNAKVKFYRMMKKLKESIA